MTWPIAIKAFFLGVLLASPIGPVGLLCLKKNAYQDRRRGLVTALGMALAYGIIAFCVLFGMKWVSGLLEEWRCPLEIVAGAALIYMGWRGLSAHQSEDKPTRLTSVYLGDFTSSFAMTLFNPVPFATFAIILTTFKILKGELDVVSDIEFSILVAAGTMSFWLVVNQILHMVKRNASSDWCRWISHGAAIALIVFGTCILIAGIWLAITLVVPASVSS